MSLPIRAGSNLLIGESGLLQSQGAGGDVADLGGAVVLDGTGVEIAGVLGPLSAMLAEELEGSAVELNQSLADDGLVGTVAALNVHHPQGSG